jgi:hypothetical protein
LRASLVEGHVEAVENAGGEPLLFTDEAEQDMLGADVVVLQQARLVLGRGR